MRTSDVYPLLLMASVLVFSGCASDGPSAGYRNGSRLTYGQETAERLGGDYNRGRRFGLFGFNRGQGEQGYGQQDCGGEGCGTAVADGQNGVPSQYTSTGNGAGQPNSSDYSFDCGPMCGAYLSDEQCQNKMVSDNYKRGNSYVRAQLNGLLPNNGEGRPFNGVRRGNRNGDAEAVAIRRGLPVGRFAARGPLAGRRMVDCEDCVSADTALMGAPQAGMSQVGASPIAAAIHGWNADG